MLFLEHLLFLIEKKILNALINSVILNVFRSFNGCYIPFVDSMSVLHRELKFCNLYDVITRQLCIMVIGTAMNKKNSICLIFLFMLYIQSVLRQVTRYHEPWDKND